MKFALQDDEICLTGQRNLPRETKKMISRGEKNRLTGRKNPFRGMKKSSRETEILFCEAEMLFCEADFRACRNISITK